MLPTLIHGMIDHVKRKRVTFAFKKNQSEAEVIQFMNLLSQAIEPNQEETTLPWRLFVFNWINLVLSIIFFSKTFWGKNNRAEVKPVIMCQCVSEHSSVTSYPHWSEQGRKKVRSWVVESWRPSMNTYEIPCILALDKGNGGNHWPLSSPRSHRPGLSPKFYFV